LCQRWGRGAKKKKLGVMQVERKGGPEQRVQAARGVERAQNRKSQGVKVLQEEQQKPILGLSKEVVLNETRLGAESWKGKSEMFVKRKAKGEEKQKRLGENAQGAGT